MTPGSPRRSFDWARAASAWGPVLLYMAGIFFASAQPEMPLQGKTSLSDKTIHALAYFGLTLFAYRAALMVPLRRRFDPAVQALVVSILYGIWDEVHQGFVPGRNMELADWTADVVGTLIAVIAVIVVRTVAHKGGTQNVRRRERL